MFACVCGCVSLRVCCMCALDCVFGVVHVRDFVHVYVRTFVCVVLGLLLDVRS